MPGKSQIGLKSSLTIATIGSVAVALIVAVALMVVTTMMQGTVEQLARSLDSVRLTEDIETDLLLHDRADAIVRRSLEGDVQAKLASARELAVTDVEHRLLAQADEQVRAHLASPTPASLDRAFASVEVIVNHYIAQGRSAQTYAEVWDARSNFIGASAVLLLLAFAGWTLWWLRRVAFRPVFEIARRMDEYTSGDLDARAVEAGPAEISLIAARFNQMADEIARKRQEALSFIAAIAHDLKNPLAAIAMATSVDPSGDEQRARRMLSVVRRQSERLNRMVGDLLDTASMEAGRLEMRLEVKDLREPVAEVAELYAASTTSHEIVVFLPSEPVHALFDATRIQQVIGNLVSNAVKYSPGAGTVTIELAAVGESAVLSVRDEGIGIAPADRDRIFEPFRRTSTSRDAFPGLGLGLSVVKRVVDAHGGHVEVDSEIGRGTTFRVVLPRATPARAAVKPDLAHTPERL